MSDNKKMDEFLRESFSDYSPDVPSQIWDNIAAERKRKRPVAFWFNNNKLLVLAALLLTISGAGWLLIQKNNKRHIALETNDNNRQQATGQKTVPAVVVNDKPGANTTGLTTPTTINDNRPTNTKTQTATGITKNISATITVATNTNSNKTTGSKQDSKLLADANESNDSNAGKDVYKGNKNRLHNNSKTSITQTGAPVEDVTVDKNEMPAEDNADAATNELLIPELPGSREQVNLAALAVLYQLTIVIKPLKNPDCPAAEKDAAGNKSYFEVYISPDYASKKYSDTGNSELIAKRKESLRTQFAYSAGIRYTRVFANGMSIRAGINYSQINEKFSFIKDNVIQLVYVIQPNGDTTDSYYVRGTRYRTSYNHYRTIDVPVVVGYEMGNGRLHANINAGVMINLYSWQSGETLDNNYMPVSITTGKEGNAAYQYKTNVGLGFTGAVSFYYKLNDRCHLLAEPYCRFNLSPMNKEAVSLQEKFTTIGLRLGLRMDF